AGFALDARYHAHAGRTARQLPERLVELRLKRFLVVRIETPLVHVPDYADDPQRVAVAYQVDALADGVLVREILAGKDLVNHHDRLRSFIILIGEEAAVLERDTHRRQIAGFNLVDQRHMHFARAGRLGLAIDPEVKIVLALQRRCACRERSRLHTRHRVDTATQLAQGSTRGLRTCRP